MGFELRNALFNQRRNNFNPRQRKNHHRRVNLILDLRGDVRFDGGLVHAIGVAPIQHLFLRQVFVRSERATRRLERAGAVARSAVGLFCVTAAGGFSAVASPIGGDNDIGERAFGGLYEKAFDEPEDGHKLAGFEGLDAGGEFLDSAGQSGNNGTIL